MFYYELYGIQAFWYAMVFSAGLILLGAGILYSGMAYKKPKGPDGEEDEHAEPGVPLVLKIVYIAFGIWYVSYTFWFAVKGLAI